MAGEAQHVGVPGAYVNRQFAECLCGVHVQPRAGAVYPRGDVGNGLHHAGFVIDRHDAHQCRRVMERGVKCGEVKQAVAANGQDAHFGARFCQRSGGVKHGFVFGLDGDEVRALDAVVAECAFEREVVRFGRAAGVDDFARLRPDVRRQLRPRVFEAAAVFECGLVGCAGVGERPRRAEVGCQLCRDLRLAGGGGGVVEVCPISAHRVVSGRRFRLPVWRRVR